MENQQKPSFSVYELAKMASLVADSMSKISVVIEALFKKDSKNAILLLQAWDNLNHVYGKLNKAGKTKAKQQGRKTLEKLEGVLEKIGGSNSNSWNFEG